MIDEKNNKEEAIAAASKEIVQYVAGLVKPWTQFYGHEDHIAEILRRHLSTCNQPPEP